MAPPCAIVIFGASGDLANRKLIPVIYELAHEKLLDERSYVLGFSRSEMSDEQFRMECRDGVQKFGRSKPIDEGVWKALEQRIYYARAEYGSAEDHARDFGADRPHGAGESQLRIYADSGSSC